MDEDYSVKIIDILEKFCKRKKLRFKYLGFKFNDRGHYNQKWKCKVSSSLQVFVLDVKFCSFNYLDLKLGNEYIEHKFTESIYYAKYGRFIDKTEHWVPSINKIKYLGEVNIKTICKIILRHRDIIVLKEIKNQKLKKKINSQMEKFL